ncbi:MAG: AraC family transcriptional regulator, partial [Lachnospiraceae bacterium]|nr:AraC family transcriptional regulator [Lachnospiraceae bacterium]
MEWVQSINKAIEYMEKHLTEDIHCEDVSRYVHISSFHFQRMFNLFTSMTVGEYIRKRRLSLAGEELTRKNTKVIDVAFKYAYNSSESFTKAFTRFHGITPRQAKKGNELKSFNKLVVKISVEGGTIMDYRIEKKEGFRLLVYASMFTEESSEKGIPAFWEEYYRNELYKKAPGYLGICAQEKDSAEEFMYGIGCDADDVKEIPEGFQIINIPAYTWAIFKCVGPTPDAIRKTWEDIYREWLPGADYELIPDFDIENYLPGDNTSCDYVSEIWI